MPWLDKVSAFVWGLLFVVQKHHGKVDMASSASDQLIEERVAKIARYLKVKPKYHDSLKSDIYQFALANFERLEPLFYAQAQYAQTEGMNPAVYWRGIITAKAKKPFWP